MPTNFQQLIDLILAANPTVTTPYSPANLAHDAPVVDGGAQNTKVMVHGISAVGFSGSVEFSYDRLDLQTQLDQLTVTYPVPMQIPNDGVVDGTISSADLLANFLATTGVELQVEDIVVEDIVLADVGVTPYTLTIRTDSLKWLGDVELELSEDSHDIGELSQTSLGGFNYQ